MTVIMKTPEHTRDRDDPDALALDCFRRFSNAYNDNAADSEAYLRQPEGEAGAARYLEFIDGRRDPEKIKRLAAGWNQRIESDFDAALAQLMSHVPPAPNDKRGRRHWLAAPATDIYSMKKAAIALDGDVHDFGSHALLVNDEYLTSLFAPNELEDVLNNPQDYVSFEVWAK